MKNYDYLIVGAGLYGSIFAHEVTKRGKKCLVIDKRNHIGGNCYTQNMNNINVHMYGPHIFHTSDEKAWIYINSFCKFDHYIYTPMANYNNELYNLPFNMNTFCKIWSDVHAPEEAMNRIKEQALIENIKTPKNLEEKALNLVGRDIYEKLIKGYSEKQWNMPAHEIPEFIIDRIPVRFTFDNNYYNDKYQGIPVGGYTQIFEKLLDGIEVRLNADFLKDRYELENISDNILYCGPIDEYFDHRFGNLEFRSLRFDHISLPVVNNYQGVAVVNYTDKTCEFTRSIEHKHFEKSNVSGTIVTFEYPDSYINTHEPYYPINNDKNDKLFEKYLELSNQFPNVSFVGRCGEYKYYDMDDIILKVLSHKWLN